MKRWDPEAERFRLIKGRDHRKDQSYFLFTLGQEQLARVIWPLRGLTKDEVRSLAAEWELPVANKGESQEICFIPNGDYRSFIEIYLPPEDLKPGEIVDPDNRLLATHAGVHAFTVGQRRGLGIPWKEPLYVLRIVPRERQVVVGPRRFLYGRELEADGVSWVTGSPPSQSFRAKVRIRYRHTEAAARVEVTREKEVRVTFEQGQRAITPGQAAVLYQDRQVLGGGWIKNAS
jgi:tRNA-specific 2-thiouridylase